MLAWDNIKANDQKNPVQKLALLVENALSDDTSNVQDVGFMRVAVSDENVSKDDFIEALTTALTHAEGDFVSVDFHELAQGPSYITLGAWIGSQQTALILMAVGAFFGIWGIATPMKLGITGEKAKELMGSGFVMVVPTNEFLELEKES